MGFSLETCSYYSLKLTGNDDILKLNWFAKFCMLSFRTRCKNVNIVVYGRPNSREQPDTTLFQGCAPAVMTYPTLGI